MIKNLLVPIDGSDFSRVALQYGIGLSRAFRARIQLLTVTDIRTIEGPVMQELAMQGDPGLGIRIAAITDRLEKRDRDYLADFHKDCERAGTACDTRLSVGVVSQEIIEVSKNYDLVVLGKHGEHVAWRGPLLGSTIESVVRGTIRPVLVTPGEYQAITKVLVAYDGSRHASGALTVAADIGQELGLPLVALVVASEPGKGQGLLEQARRYLEPYRLDVKEVLVDGEPYAQILKTCAAEQCNLITMGAYGHSPLREFILGSTTTRIMRAAPWPVLLYR